ncbi:helix-turn-helix domain-containing protein [Streptomyces mutabilis]|uniref:helix-turn-helix transcriptional regulator n=1 Tax=Streptomyces mutabilis TaxID=67332 RepID=UPI0022BA2B9D|nr:helix-turn-helix transcriptional regulator [Streptomyces mutabilis]MCZ9353209.1 helix-turn-helix domain-containing protein [Streptomyces mutabilis]
MTDKREPTQEERDAAAEIAATLRTPDGPERLFGTQLRALRERWGYSQEELARAMRKAGFKWQQTTTAKTEAGSRPLRLNEAFALAGCFGVTVDDLLFAGNLDDEAKESLASFQLANSLLGATMVRFDALLAHREAVDVELEGLRRLVLDLKGEHEQSSVEAQAHLRRLIADNDQEIARLRGAE